MTKGRVIVLLLVLLFSIYIRVDSLPKNRKFLLVMGFSMSLYMIVDGYLGIANDKTPSKNSTRKMNERSRQMYYTMSIAELMCGLMLMFGLLYYCYKWLYIASQ